MGWCPGTEIFDVVAEELLGRKDIDVKIVLKRLIEELEDHDWDCQEESHSFDHPLVQEIMKELHPDWDWN